MYWASSALGVIILGIISDHYGRIRATRICFTLSVTEFVDIKKRLMVSMGYFSFQSLTNGILPWLAYSIGNWKYLSLVTSSVIFMPESVRWLMAKGEINKAKKNIQIVAKFNGQKISGYILDNIQFFTRPSEPLKRIFSYKKFLKMFFLTCFMWLLICLTFIGSNVFSSTLSKHPFFMITINSLIDVIGTIIASPLADNVFYLTTAFFARKLIIDFAKLCFYMKLYLVSGDSKLFLTLFFLARMTLMMVFNIKLLYAAEVYPTAIRNRAVSLRMAIGSFGCFLSPLIVGLRFLDKKISLLVFGVCIGVAGVIMMFLPETKGRQLPETLEDAENQFLEQLQR
ncbi:organic cation/carnitine transporter-like protein [Dinothrombium tinctorium]|uniref:Organic cation/carnitine transporter-like protein n=1 Tax=Dinothrombium tinctorium TaxID=1965070 RepID=A0A3S3SJM7_9ACAR|nr:organic cation/carnitine transporter-like protein [Dinothrombium tinctorium]RWS15012.1 organic cation/carnitine transporter-like protein [Dinothrombium tinctorium]